MKKKIIYLFASILIITLGLIIFLKFYNKVNSNDITQETIIAIQPFGNFNKDEALLAKREIEHFYNIKVELLTSIDYPKSAFIDVKSPRYRADSLIRYLKKNLNSKYDYVIGLTNKDISTTKYSNRNTKTIKKPIYKYSDWGIFGLGFMPGKSCIVSTYRLKDKKFESRFIKICCHELGHNFGLPHCSNKKCIMQDAAETIKTIDRVELNLCDDCKKKIGIN